MIKEADMIINFLIAAVLAGAPLVLATVGEIITEKSGNINLGVEGTMYIGAVASLAGAVAAEKLGLSGFGAAAVSFIAGALSGMITSALFGFMTISLRVNQNVVGLIITIMGTGIGNFFGELMGQGAGGYISVTDETKGVFSGIRIPGLSSVPVIGELLFSYNGMVYFSLAAALAAFFIIKKTKIGLKLTAVGENPYAADAAGVSVTKYRYIASVIGGALCGLAGMYMCMVTNSGVWVHGCISGYGWLAVALVIFSAWNPLKSIFCSIIFGALMIMRLYIAIPGLNPFIYDMCPYIVTSIVIIITSIRKTGKDHIPESLGENYYIDYLKYGRPKATIQNVFLTGRTPIMAFSDTSSLSGIIVRYARMAKIDLSKRKHGMHSLRHTLATRLMEENIPISTIANILGHTSTDTVKKYLQVDTHHLRGCALDVEVLL